VKKRIDLVIGLVAALSMAVAPSFAGGVSSAASQDLPGRDASGGISMPGAFSPETAQPQTLGMRADALSQSAQFWQLETIRDQLVAVTAAPEADLSEQMLAERAKDPSVIGIGMEAPELGTVAATQASFVSFDAIDGGRLLALRIRTPGAVGMRLGLLVEQMPSQVSVAFADVAGNEPVAPPVTVAEITQIMEANRAAGDLSDEGRTYWSPMLEGEEALILVHVPGNVEADAVRFSIPRISYIFDDPLSKQSNELFQSDVAAQSAAYCNLDATCFPDWNVGSRAVAKMVYTKGAGSYLCTGYLINDSDSSGFIPYFLTANHCISTQTAASTLQTHWYHQSAACNSSTRDSRYTVRYGGAQLLYASAAMDAAFLRLNQPPPGGAYFLGWSTADSALYDDLIGIHHPQGDWKKISGGEFVRFVDCWSSTGSGFECTPASSTTGNYLEIDWYAGTTEGGSSGSGLLNTNGQVIGTLLGGNGLCAPYGKSTYGRFSVAYADGLKDWLNPPPPGTYDWQVQQMYIAYYGRPGDPAGVDYWAGRLAAVGGNWINDLVNAFGTSAEYTSRFGALGDETLISNLYQQLFNRAAEPVGLSFYVDLLNGTNASGLNPSRRQSTLAQIALDMANGAQNDDSVILQNKLAVSAYFTERVQATGTAYTAADIPAAVAILASVDASPASVDAARALVDNFVQ
jgi:hypothetical protein